MTAVTAAAAGLNVGCGEFYADGWLNIDRTRVEEGLGPRPDMVVDVRSGLPFDDAAFDRVYMGHVLEHLPETDIPAVLAEVSRVLRPAGQLLVVGPDANRMTLGSELLAEVESGGHRWAGDEHQWICTGVGMFDHVWRAGFDARMVDITSPDLEGWPLVSRIWWQAAVHATKRAEGEE